MPGSIKLTMDVVDIIVQTLPQVMSPEDARFKKCFDLATRYSLSNNCNEQSAGEALLWQLEARVPPAPSAQETAAPIAQETESPFSQDFLDFFHGIGCALPVVPAAEYSDSTPSLSTGSTPNESPALATPSAPSPLLFQPSSFHNHDGHQPHGHSGTVASPEVVNVPALPCSILPALELKGPVFDHEDKRTVPKNRMVTCEWDGCGEQVHYSHIWLHIAGKKNGAVHISGKHIERGGKYARCQWDNCTNEAPMLFDSLRRHIEGIHLHLSIECARCGTKKREDAYRRFHGLARNCDRPKVTKPPLPSSPRATTSVDPAPALQSVVGPIRPKRARASRKKAQEAVAYPSSTDSRHGRRAEQRSTGIRPRSVTDTSSSSHGHMSMPAFFPFDPVEAPFRAPQQGHSIPRQAPHSAPAFVQGSSTGRHTATNAYAAPVAPAPAPPMYNYTSTGSDHALERSFSQYFDQPTAGPSYFQMDPPAPLPTGRAPLQDLAPSQGTASVGGQGAWMGQSNFPHVEFPTAPEANPMPQYTSDPFKSDFDSYPMWPASDAENQPPYFGAPY
ncbi:hypothetical protein TRAPUB_3196 [Trametes pubescens]|uniref:Uncharacterized protein n=1 Tax=Trametes pubescens TaxID=154538 RepID=A0A1M2VEG9_TRAPU|nr:hypothetical protein TRAPUB_3196 [Trametes pubescens]